MPPQCPSSKDEGKDKNVKVKMKLKVSGQWDRGCLCCKRMCKTAESSPGHWLESLSERGLVKPLGVGGLSFHWSSHTGQHLCSSDGGIV